MSAWFSIDDDKYLRRSDHRYKTGTTVFFDVSSFKNVRKDVLIYTRGICKLDGKKYYYQKYSIEE